MLRSAATDGLRPQRDGYFGAQSHTPRSTCVRFVTIVTSGSRNTRLQAGSLRLTWAGLSPADRASRLAPSGCPPYETCNSFNNGPKNSSYTFQRPTALL